MKIDLCRSVGRVLDESTKSRIRHPPGLAQSTHAIRKTDPVLAQARNRPGAQRAENVAEKSARRWFADEAREGEAVLAGNRQGQIEDDWMQMQMRVSVPITGRETECAESVELRADFSSERGLQRGAEEVAQASLCG